MDASRPAPPAARPTPAIRRIGATRDLLGESPCWDARRNSLWWIDAMAGVVHRRCLDTGIAEQHALPAPLGSIALCESGALVVALQHGFARYQPDTRTLEPYGRIDDGVADARVRLNDGKCDPWGNFIAGTLHGHRAEGEPLRGGLYRLRPGGAVEKIADAFSLANGPCFSPDGRTFYVADSLARTIWAYDYRADRPLERRRVFVSTEAFAAGPDGAAVDVEGFLWTMLPRAGRVARFAPDGRLDFSFVLPVSYPSSLCFGGGVGEVFFTSISRSPNLVGEREVDGGVFLLEGLGVLGVPVSRFGA